MKPARTPERQRLADAIIERDRRHALLQAKRAEHAAEEERRWPLYQRRDELETQLRRTGGLSGEADRREALLRGDAPPERGISDVLRAEITEIDAELARSQKAEAELLNDIQLLDTPCLMARLEVEEAIRAVMQADPVRAALLDELLRLQPRVAMLRRAANAAFGLSDPGAGYAPSSINATPCPWQAARDRLVADPDAPLPTLDDVFAASPPRSAA